MLDGLPVKGGVNDHIQRAFRLMRAGNHQVILDAAFVVQKKRVAHLARLQNLQSAWHDLLDRGGRIRPVFRMDIALTHVRHIKQTRLRAAELMLFHDAERILNRHGIARERNHARVTLVMQRVQGRFLDFVFEERI